MCFYTGRPIFCLERGAAHGFQRYQMDCTLAHFDEEATIQLSTHASHVCLPVFWAVEQWSTANDCALRSRPLASTDWLRKDENRVFISYMSRQKVKHPLL